MTSRRQQYRKRMIFFWIATILVLEGGARAFMVRTPPSPLFPNHHYQRPQVLPQPKCSPKTYAMARLVTSRLSTRLFESSSATTSPDKMRSKEIRQELESYGISTKSFLEKKELVEALEKARAEGLKPKNDAKKAESKEDQVNGEQASDGKSRKERIDEEKAKAKSKKVGELKKELQDMGISTKSFFEKSEFVQAYAEAMVDGPPKSRAGSSRRQASPQQEEKYDPSYRDVVMQKFDPRLLGRSPIIDVTLGR